MLAEIIIKDFAIIEDLKLSFTSGLNILTGETGAGKSILVDALGAVLGDRVHGEQVRTGKPESRIEAVFRVGEGHLKKFLTGRGVAGDEDGCLYLQRCISPSGRHQAYINGSPVPLSLLAEVGALLVDIHGQHQHQTLLKEANHLIILDDFGELSALREEFRSLYAKLADLDARLGKALEERKNVESKRDFIAFQLKEIEVAGLTPREDEELDRARAAMVNAEKIALLGGEALNLLYEGESAASGQVEAAARRIEELARFIPEVGDLAVSLRGCGAVLKEAAGNLQEWLRLTEYDPERHNQIEERLAVIARLKRKYGATVDGIIARGRELRAELEDLEGVDTRMEGWRRERDGVLAEMAGIGPALSRGRVKTAGRIEKEVGSNLASLGMEKARFSVRLSPRRSPDGVLALGEELFDPGEGGLEEAEFLLSANPGEELKSLVKVASGGELSRIMLALKTALAKVDRVGTLIFDEIDTGIGGAVARTVGRAMKKLSGSRQVICVTHLPQIASLADTHFLVAKSVSRGKTRVSVSSLTDEERVAEVARMTAGETVTPAAVRHARELMEGA